MSRVKLTQDNKAVEQIQPYAVLYIVSYECHVCTFRN